MSLLHDAVNDCDLLKVKKLLEHDHDPNSLDEDQQTPLHIAVCITDPVGVDIVQFLIESGADVNMTDLYGQTPLHNLSQMDNDHEALEKIISLFIEQGADLSIEDHDGRTPFQVAKDNGNWETQELLRHKMESTTL